jgi:hypothetical protein
MNAASAVATACMDTGMNWPEALVAIVGIIAFGYFFVALVKEC